MKTKKHRRTKREGKVEKADSSVRRSGKIDKKKKLEIVLKCDSVGSQEAVVTSLASVENPEVELKVIQAGVGSISKSDLFMALTGSRLVMGFNVDVMPQNSGNEQRTGN